MPPKFRAGVTKACESCDFQIPVACKTCPECSYELIPERREDRDREASPGGEEMESNTGGGLMGGKGRRSSRVKREQHKPDYYDALDYDSKRQKTPKVKKDGSFIRSPSAKVRRQVSYPAGIQPTRATLTWKKGGEEEEEEAGNGKKKRKRPREREIDPEEGSNYMEEISSEKVLQCAVNLAEINRRLGIVMRQPR